MAKKENQSVKKQTKQKKTISAGAPAPKTTTSAGEEKVVTAEEVTTRVATKPETLLQRPSGSGTLSADGKVRLLDLARRTFVEETRPHLQFPKETQVSINRIVAVGILCSIADHVVDGDDTFAQVMQQQGYTALVKAAEDLGYKIPDIKALPVTKDGQVQLSASQVEIPEDKKEELKREKQIRTAEKPELDPEKIESEEDLKKALEYMFVARGSKNLGKLLTSTVDFMKKFRSHQAEAAENTDEAKARYANYNYGDWLDDIFSYFKPTIFFQGIGRGMESVIAVEKNPIHAFVIFRDAIVDKETKKPVLADEDIASCVKSIVKWICNTNIASNKKAIENLDPKKNKKEIETCENSIAKYNKSLAYVTDPSFDEVDHLLENIGSHFDEGGTLTEECQRANATFNRVCKTYYGEQLSTADYNNLEENIQQYAGCIINLFRDAGSQLANYKLANITELSKCTDEERQERLKKAKKEWNERKAAKEKEEKKNA